MIYARQAVLGFILDITLRVRDPARMLDHVIIFRADNLSSSVEAELMRQFSRLAQLPGVEGFALGKNFSDRSRGFDYCLRITFTDKDALDAYMVDPLHLEVVAYNRSVTSEHICVDFFWEPIPTPN